MRKVRVLLVLALLAGSAACTSGWRRHSVHRWPASTSWERMLADFTEEYFRLTPDRASHAGRHEYDGVLPDWTPAGMKNRSVRLRALEDAIAAVPDDELTEDEKFQRRYLLFAARSERFWNSQSDGPYTSIDHYRHSFEIFHLVNGGHAPLGERMAAVTRFQLSLVSACAQIRANMRLPMSEELREHSEQVVRGLAEFLGKDAAGVFQKIQDENFSRANRAALAALGELAEFYASQKGKSTASFALGTERFQAMLAAVEGVNIPLAQVKRAALEDLARNRSALAKECGEYAPGKPIAECVDRATSEKPDDVIQLAESQVRDLKRFVLKNEIVAIPSDEEVIVRETPGYLRWNTASLRSPGIYDREEPSVYFIAPPDPSWPKETRLKYLKSKAELLITSAHEVWPGHFLHTLHDNLRPPLLGRILRTYTTVEGWAHYTEEMMVETGLGDGDPRVKIAQLKWALVRDARMLSSIGLHTEGWTREKSESFFVEQAYASPALAKQQSMRGVFDPDYLGYTLGKLMVLKLREDWTKTRGGRAAWRAFHDRFVSYGNAPVALIRAQMMGGEGEAGLL